MKALGFLLRFGIGIAVGVAGYRVYQNARQERQARRLVMVYRSGVR